mgnify:CR=1 FL=1
MLCRPSSDKTPPQSVLSQSSIIAFFDFPFADIKIDLTLSGHTHNGQIVPFNFLVKLRFKNIYGLYEKFQSKLYVSCGVGCWGPRMRLGSTNEIVLLSISNQA